MVEWEKVLATLCIEGGHSFSTAEIRIIPFKAPQKKH